MERKGWLAALRVSSCRVATITFPDPHFRDVPSLRSKRLVCVPVPDLSHTVSTKSFKQLLFEGRGRNLRRKGLKRQQFLGIALQQAGVHEFLHFPVGSEPVCTWMRDEREVIRMCITKVSL